MKLIISIPKMQEFSRQVRTGGLSIGFVPTMGSLHEGHIELVRRARGESDVVVVSIFVNPAQFDRKEDFDRYPREEQRDREMLERERVDVLFMPAAEHVYTPGATTRVRVEGLTDTLCGPRRPGHFEGVATIVAALFNMVAPDSAWFGEKDYQQLQVVRRMARALRFPVEIVGVPTLREADGLAMSSRNARLTPAHRVVAPAIHRALEAALQAWRAGETRSAVLGEIARRVIADEAARFPASAKSISPADFEIEYLDVVDGETLRVVDRAGDGCVVATAVWLGGVRLIDNVVLRCASDARESEADQSDARPPDSAASNPVREAHGGANSNA